MLMLLLSPQTPEDDPQKRLRTQQEACTFIDGRIKVQPLVVRVKGGTTEPQVVVRLIFIVADPARSFFRSVDQVLPTAKCRMVSATEAYKMSHIGLGNLDVFSTVEVYRVGGGVERHGDEWCRAGASNDGSAGGAVFKLADET